MHVITCSYIIACMSSPILNEAAVEKRACMYHLQFIFEIFSGTHDKYYLYQPEGHSDITGLSVLSLPCSRYSIKQRRIILLTFFVSYLPISLIKLSFFLSRCVYIADFNLSLQKPGTTWDLKVHCLVPPWLPIAYALWEFTCSKMSHLHISPKLATQMTIWPLDISTWFMHLHLYIKFSKFNLPLIFQNHHLCI